MWITRYPRPTEIKRDQRSEFIGHEFKIALLRSNMELNPRKSRWEIQIPMQYQNESPRYQET